MKTIIIAILLATASISSAVAQNPTAEYRMWSAEQMINRLTEKFGRSHAACDQVRVQAFLPRLSEACKESIYKAYPVLNTIREIAASGDEVQWAALIDKMHAFEREIEAPLNNLERK